MYTDEDLKQIAKHLATEQAIINLKVAAAQAEAQKGPSAESQLTAAELHAAKSFGISAETYLANKVIYK